MAKEFIPFLSEVAFREPLMWVVDTDRSVVIDMTPATAALVQSLDQIDYQSTIAEEIQGKARKAVVATGESSTIIEWVKVSGAWSKRARTKSHAGGSLVLEISQDITRFDPRAEWLARINLVDQRLELDNGESISFDEFVVLHLICKGVKHKRIATTLDVSPKTVEYRIARLKNALLADTTEEMMMEVSSSGLIYLAVVPIDLGDPAQTELELYRKVPD